MPLDTAPQSRPAHCLTFEQACEIVAPPSLDRAARYAALKLKHGVRPGVPAVLTPEEAEALKWDRYNESGPRRLPDDGFEVERWAGVGR